MRKIIAAFRMSLDGFIEANDKQDWVDSWGDIFEITPEIDTCILGGGMYPGYEQYWSAVLANPHGILPFTGKAPAADEIDYAHFVEKTPHIVLSTTSKDVKWKNTSIVRTVEEIRKLKEQSGKDIYAVGGPTFVSSLLNLHLIDELRLLINPIILGGGKLLFRNVTERHLLKLVTAQPFRSGVKLIYTFSS